MKLEVKKYLAEALGTCVLVFVACGAAVFSGSVAATALTFGLVIVAMAYSIGNVSGCHINPAVSLAMLINKKISLADFLFYVLAQFIGGIIGGALLFAVVKLGGFSAVGNMGATGYAVADTVPRQIILSLIVEIVLTFVFMFAILGVTSKKENSKIAGLVIGLTLVAVIAAGANLTGPSVNPARSFGVAIFGGKQALSEVWVSIVGPLVGATIAGFAAKFLFKPQNVEIPAK